MASRGYSSNYHPETTQDHIQPRSEGLLKVIEEINQSGCNPQFQSPLFQIPVEVREKIFSYVLDETDGKTAIGKDDYYYRPDYAHFRYIDTALLSTCRQVWVETYDIPRRNVSPRLWLGENARSSPRRFAYALSAYEDVLFPLSDSVTRRRTIYPNESLQVFAQMYALEWGQLTKAVRSASKRIPIRRLTITLRYTDWWNWENNAPLQIDNFWSEKFRAPDSVEVIVLEMETRTGKRVELDALVQSQISKWKFHTVNSGDLVLNWDKPIEKKYVGSSKPGGIMYEHHTELANRSRILGPDEMMYYSIKMVWIKDPSTAPAPGDMPPSSIRRTATAQYNWEGEDEGDLSFEAGAVIENIEMIDDNWWTGECDGHEGIFPANYVELEHLFE